MKKHIISILLAALLLLSSFPLGVFAVVGNNNTSRGDNLLENEREKAIYNLFKGMARTVAANGGSTIVKVSSDVFGEISVPYSGEASVKNDLSTALYANINFTKIIKSLSADLPYELYWFDKTSQVLIGFSYKYNEEIAIIDTVTAYFPVCESYRAAGYSPTTPAVKAEVSSLAYIVSNAKAVVAANKDKSDMDKLAAYRDYICGAVSYNSDATINTPYGDPWQLIYVFDDNANTNVTCEGYAKAFQYLVSLSEFDGKVDSYLVSGHMQGGIGEGEHMWNVVMTDKGNFIVDLTNSDADSMGEAGELFMNALPKTGNSDGYVFVADGSNVSYYYDDETKMLYNAKIRTLGYYAPTLTGMIISPAKATVALGGSAGFTVTLSGVGDFDKSIIWTVSGALADGTKIENGVLTVDANESAKTLTVTATAASDNSIFASATVTVLYGNQGDSVLYGDCNKDGKIGPLDASLILQYDAMLIGSDMLDLAAADVSGDNSVGALDASLILQYDAMLIFDFPVERK